MPLMSSFFSLREIMFFNVNSVLPHVYIYTRAFISMSNYNHVVSNSFETYSRKKPLIQQRILTFFSCWPGYLPKQRAD